MKKVLVSLFLLVFVVSSVSLGAVAKSKKKATKKTEKVVKTVEPVSVPQTISTMPIAQQSTLTVSPKIELLPSGGAFALGFGCEASIPIMQSIKGMAELVYIPGSFYNMMVLAANGIYYFDKSTEMPVQLYAGGGLSYNILSVASVFGSLGSSASFFGLQIIGGADIPVAGLGVLFAQGKYSILQIEGENIGGFGLEGGYRFAF